MYRIVLVDDQVLFVEALKTVIESRSDGFEVVGVFYDGASAVDQIAELRPDLVLMDVRMPGLDGVQATRRLLARIPETRVLMLTTYSEDSYVVQAVTYGAVGYLLKDMPPDALIACMHSALSGQFQLPSKFASQFIASGTAPGRPSRQTAASAELPDWLYELSRKERFILRLIVDGLTNDEISARVFLAPQTVKNYVSRLYARAEVDSRPHLIKIARDYIEYL